MRFDDYNYQYFNDTIFCPETKLAKMTTKEVEFESTKKSKVNLLEYIENKYGEYDFFEHQKHKNVMEYDFTK